MRKLIVQEWISLDGYCSDRHGKLDFFVPTVREIYHDRYYKSYLEEFDCLLFGRKTYEQFAAIWPGRENDFLADKVNSSQKIVFSKSITDAPWGKWKHATIDTGNPVESIKVLKSGEGKGMVIWGSISLVLSMMQANLVDEYYLHVCPVILGVGRRLMPDGLDPVSLKLVDSRNHESGLISLHYQHK
jgi:dihydrofolate reductase